MTAGFEMDRRKNTRSLEYFLSQTIAHSCFHEGLMGLLKNKTKRATPWSSSFLYFIIPALWLPSLQAPVHSER